jgi:hypothetical protein
MPWDDWIANPEKPNHASPRHEEPTFSPYRAEKSDGYWKAEHTKGEDVAKPKLKDAK